MRIILDTGILFRPDLLKLFAELEHPVVLPVVAYAERVRQLVKQGRSIGEFDSWLARNLITVEPMNAEQASRFAAKLNDDATWLRLARDAFIAGHLGPEDMLWTTNGADFRTLGVPEHQIAPLPRES